MSGGELSVAAVLKVFHVETALKIEVLDFKAQEEASMAKRQALLKAGDEEGYKEELFEQGKKVQRDSFCAGEIAAEAMCIVPVEYYFQAKDQYLRNPKALPHFLRLAEEINGPKKNCGLSEDEISENIMFVMEKDKQFLSNCESADVESAVVQQTMALNKAKAEDTLQIERGVSFKAMCTSLEYVECMTNQEL